MFRDWNDRPKSLTPVNCLLAGAGLGDHVASLVAVNHIITSYPWINLLVWVPDYLLDYAKNVLPANAIVRDYTQAVKKYDSKKIGLTTEWRSQHTPMKIHPVYYAMHMLADEHPVIEKCNYLQIKFDQVDVSTFNLPKKYVCIQATFAEVVKTMPNKTINEIAAYVKSRGYTPVFLGKTENKVGVVKQVNTAKEADVDYSIGINLVDKTDILQSAKIIQGAAALVSMDGGITHMAGSTTTPIVVGYTFIDPAHNLPIRNNEIGWNCYTVVPDEKLGCRFCQTRTNFLMGHDYRNCYYPKDKPFACVDYMKSDKFITHLEGILIGERTEM